MEISNLQRKYQSLFYALFILVLVIILLSFLFTSKFWFVGWLLNFLVAPLAIVFKKWFIFALSILIFLLPVIAILLQGI